MMPTNTNNHNMESKISMMSKQKEQEYRANVCSKLRNNTTSIIKQTENLDEAQLYMQEAQ
jgi:hypothetical protein